MASAISDLPFTENFTFGHSVLLDVSLAEAFETIGKEESFERVARLSELCTEVKLLRTDKTTIPRGATLAETSVTKLPEASEEDLVDPYRQAVHRYFFEMEETMGPYLFGLIQYKVQIRITLSYLDPQPNSRTVYSLYENEVQGMAGIKMWKLRKFEAVVGDDGATRTQVTEECRGWAPMLLKSIAVKVGEPAHKAHMESYHTLFKA